MYVQDRMVEAEGLIWQLLEEGGHFYVCGDASQMAGAVERTLLRILTLHLVHLALPSPLPHASKT